ncbi:pantothenate kinase [Helicobacter pylori]|uniref:Pantothenate kinase n=3 Tax=Helicobacter pylori TaxID=210 RepID=O25392_HELPY|nr:predicted coding region HP0682 [Helicobacter pylori 26695]AUV74869.1 pantothenate kinase [Helicobacter pylori]AUV76365.1 pantothenate kinase [Helicobacter pylori]AUV77856.1 pantothenate kinase [Helicobacter pylori]AUV79365.1 pantothenate kinase [Helicobacter pylori]
MCQTCLESQFLNLNFMKGFVMSGLRTFSCVVVLCGAMANVAIASPKIEARGELGKFIGGGVGGFVGDKMGGFVGGAIGGYIGSEIGDRVEDYIRGVDREPQNKEPQAPREPIRDLYDYGYSFGHAW